MKSFYHVGQLHVRFLLNSENAVYNTKKSIIIASQILAQLTFNDEARSRQYAPIQKRFDEILKILQDASKESNQAYNMSKTEFRLRR